MNFPLVDMWLLWFCLIFHTAFYTEAAFGTPYLQNSRLCKPWNCLSAKLGISNNLPPLEDYKTILTSLLPSGHWQDVVDKVLDTCYHNRPRNYVNTCPGQALLHCTVDNLIENCPEEYWRKDDGCYPVSSLAGTKNMFTQSRYENLEKNLPKEKRPPWFMRNYFNAKCCNLPELVHSSFLSECGFTTFIHYYDHKPDKFPVNVHFMKQATTTHKPTDKKVYDFNSIHISEKPESSIKNRLKIVPLPVEEAITDPLQCCDMSDFILPTWRSECGLHLSWDRTNRLTVGEDLTRTTTVPPTTTTRAPVNRDVRVVPLSCEQETCVFRKLNIISESGSVDTEAFSKLLDNFTALHPTWAKAKARVITQCLARPNRGYKADCEINKLLACTLDVLSENCPYSSKIDPCRHIRRNNSVCQISSSMFRPKNRRVVCGLPNLVNSDVLSECGLTSIMKTEYVPVVPVVKVTGWRTSKYACKDSTPPMTCIMSKMGVLNKYGFMDYFKMKDRIRDFVSRHQEWSPLTEVYINAFSGMPMYREHCSSPRKLMNVIDTMLMTCPVSKQKATPQCTAVFSDMINAPPDNQNMTKDKLDMVLRHFNHMFLPSHNIVTPAPTRKILIYTKKNPPFDFGLLNSSGIPPVETISLNKNKDIPVILPVYLRERSRNAIDMNTKASGNYKDGVFHSSSYLLHGKIPATPLIPPGLP